MKNEELIRGFIHGAESGENETGSMHIENYQNGNTVVTVLYSYATPIAYREFTDENYMTFWTVDKKFSSTTSRHQSMFKNMIDKENNLLWHKYEIAVLSPFVFSESLKRYKAGLGLLHISY